MITNIFWAHKESIALAKCFPSIIVVDSTYKTNKYKMPLLEIVGISSSNRSFNVAFVFMDWELESNYTWSLDMLKLLLGESATPRIFVTDGEMALIKAIKAVFPTSGNYLTFNLLLFLFFIVCKKLLNH